MGAGGAAAAPVGAEVAKSATAAWLVPSLISAGAGMTTGLAQSMLAQDPKEQKMSMPTPSPGGIGARPAGQPLFGARQELNPLQRSSLAAQLLSRS